MQSPRKPPPDTPNSRRTPTPKGPRKSKGPGESKGPESAESAEKSPGSPGRPDRTVIVLGAVALVLLILIIVFFRRGGPPGGGEAAEPVIERIPVEDGDDTPEEPVIELGRPAPPEAPPEPETPEKKAPPPGAEAEQTTARLFFIRVSDEGKIGHKSVLRRVPVSSSPLTVAVNALIEGPRAGELTNDMMSLIPEGSQLLGARVEGGIAFLDFNEEFRFNALGIEGYRAQAEQLVYTVTEFPTVDKVQFLVEGQRIDYLGGEGFWVGAPLGRDDF